MKRDTFLLLFLAVFLHSGALDAQIAVVKTANVAAFDEARNGFSSICFEDREEFNLTEDDSNRSDVLSQLKSGTYRLILAIGPQAAAFVKTNFPDVPMVYCMVMNQRQLNLNGDKVTGVEFGPSIREQFAILKQVAKKVKRVGVIFTRPANDALIDEAQRLASAEKLTLVPMPITSSDDLQSVLNQVQGRCEAVWIPPDPSLGSDEVARSIGTALAQRLPVVGPSDRFVRAGALFSISPDAIETGRAAGEQANSILQGRSPAEIEVRRLEKTRVIINLKVASQLGLTFPRNVQDAASKVYQ